VIVFENGEDYEQEVKICQFLQKSGIDGLVVAPARTTNDLDHFVKLQHEGIPMVFFDRIAPNLDTDRVLEDDYKGACTVVRHMIDGGCRKIAHIALPRRYLWAQKREKGYLQALKDRHLFTDEKLIVECEDVSEVYRITRQLVLHSGVDGIFAANDAFAVHVLSVLRQMKCRVPEEVAVCGYGNEPSTEVTFPALTTVNKDGYRVGNIAAGLLIRRIEDKEEVPTVTRLLKPELIVRDSTLSVDR
jgi:DNA-binding LacI/PurR family transcriptional regulator